MWSTDQSHPQYRGECAVQISHTLGTEKGVQHGSVTPSYSRECAVWISHISRTDKSVQYRTTKTAQGVVGGCIYLPK